MSNWATVCTGNKGKSLITDSIGNAFTFKIIQQIRKKSNKNRAIVFAPFFTFLNLKYHPPIRREFHKYSQRFRSKDICFGINTCSRLTGLSPVVPLTLFVKYCLCVLPRVSVFVFLQSLSY